MTEGLQRESAVIIPFGQRVRLVAARPRRAPAPVPQPQQAAVVATGGCWYHDAAIREDETGRKG